VQCYGHLLTLDRRSSENFDLLTIFVNRTRETLSTQFTKSGAGDRGCGTGNRSSSFLSDGQVPAVSVRRQGGLIAVMASARESVTLNGKTIDRGTLFGLYRMPDEVRMTKAPLITKQELWEFVDGGLTPERRRQLEVILSDFPELAAEVAAMRRQNEALKAVGGGALDAPIPKAMLETIRKAAGGEKSDAKSKDPTDADS
jgi:hypothetical protein